MNKFFEDGMDPAEIGVKISEMLVATAESSDDMIDKSISQVLRMLRIQLKMDVVFVSEFVDGQRVFRRVESAAGAPIKVGDSDPLETTYCQRIVDGRMPPLIKDMKALPADMAVPHVDIPIGAHLSTPIKLKDGSVYGTLCCFSAKANPQLADPDLTNLKLAAELAARNIC